MGTYLHVLTTVYKYLKMNIIIYIFGEPIKHVFGVDKNYQLLTIHLQKVKYSLNE